MMQDTDEGTDAGGVGGTDTPAPDTGGDDTTPETDTGGSEDTTEGGENTPAV